MSEPSSTGLPSRLAAVLAYGAWWISGALFWWAERRDMYVRFHAAQAITAFGLLALLIATLGLMAVVSLQVAPAAFHALITATGVAWALAFAVWCVATWHAATGRRWRMPLVGRLAERLARSGAEPPA